jgi:hypothetical protein
MTTRQQQQTTRQQQHQQKQQQHNKWFFHFGLGLLATLLVVWCVVGAGALIVHGPTAAVVTISLVSLRCFDSCRSKALKYQQASLMIVGLSERTKGQMASDLANHPCNAASLASLMSGMKRKADGAPGSSPGYEVSISPTTVYQRGSPCLDQTSDEWNYHNEWTPICAASLFNNTRNNWRSYHKSWLKQGGIEKLNNCGSGTALNQLLMEFHENTKHGRQSIWTIVNSTLQLLGMGIKARKGYSSWSAIEKRSFHDIIMMLEGNGLDVVKVALGMRLSQVSGVTAVSKLANSSEMQKSCSPVGSIVSFPAESRYTAKPCDNGNASSCLSPGQGPSGDGGVCINPGNKTRRVSFDNFTSCSPRNLFCGPESATDLDAISF